MATTFDATLAFLTALRIERKKPAETSVPKPTYHNRNVNTEETQL